MSSIHRCQKCEGTGFLKYDPIICNICDGIKCMFCNNTGLERMPWDLCDKCCGDGEITVQDAVTKSDT